MYAVVNKTPHSLLVIACFLFLNYLCFNKLVRYLVALYVVGVTLCRLLSQNKVERETPLSLELKETFTFSKFERMNVHN